MRNFKVLLISGRAEVELLAAKDGRSALELAQARLPDLILLDLQLSDMNGLELIDQLKTDEATRKIPVVLIGGASD
jgi:CheY-like chemotaxis protein